MNQVDKLQDKYEQALGRAPEWVQDLIGGDSAWDIISTNGLQAIAIGAIGWAIATFFERRHNAYMSKRENLLEDIAVSTNKEAGEDAEIGIMIYGSVVVAHDFFRTLVIQFRKIIGGNIKAYERLVARGRREAFIRMREDARLRGFDRVINVRFAGSHVSGRFISAVELVAYGTGIKSKP